MKLIYKELMSAFQCIPKEGNYTVFRVLSVENEVLIFPFFGPYQEVRTGRVKRFRSHMPLGLTLHEDSPG